MQTADNVAEMLESLLHPGSIAVIGASRTPGKFGHTLVRNLVEYGFEGEIVLVNPNADSVLGLKTYPGLKAYGRGIDLSIVAVPAALVKDAVRDSVDAGAKSVIVLSAGFKEVGGDGVEREGEIVEICGNAGVRLLGPNCLGLINTECRLNASVARRMPSPGGVSIFSQSGAVCSTIVDWAHGRKLGLAKFVSLGNKGDLDEVDLLEALAADDQTKVICGYLETIAVGDTFVKAAENAASLKPVIILKVGTTEAGGRAATKHTGELDGRSVGYGAAFKRSGVVRADTFEDLLDYATAFGLQPLPRGNRVAVVTNAGGPGIMAADAVDRMGLEMAELGERSIATLKKKLPDGAVVFNPVDIMGDADPDRYVTAVTTLQDDENTDCLIVIMTNQVATQPVETAQALKNCLSGEKPMIFIFMGGEEMRPGRDELATLGLPYYISPERGVKSMKAMVDYAAWRKRPPRIITRFPVNRRRVERILNRHVRRGHAEITEVHAKEILRAYDFNVPEGDITSSAEDAVEVAERIGYPVAMKIASYDIIHKSDVGGVKLNVADSEAVRDTFELMMLRVHRRAPEARVDGIYVEQMCSPGLEVIIGMRLDPDFGPMLMFGLGGIFVEVMEDVTFNLAPITENEAMQMLMSTRSYKMLKGRRGRAAMDLQAVASGLQRISQLVTDFPQIAELDINPFVVREFGSAPVVVDARMILWEMRKEQG